REVVCHEAAGVGPAAADSLVELRGRIADGRTWRRRKWLPVGDSRGGYSHRTGRNRSNRHSGRSTGSLAKGDRALRKSAAKGFHFADSENRNEFSRPPHRLAEVRAL